MKLTAILALGGLASLTIAVPTAAAAPPCTASGLASTASGVLGQAGSYLDAHPDANEALTSAGTQGGDAEGTLRAYFSAHPGEFLDLQNIARPLTALRGQCGVSISPAQLAALFNALS
jgi:heme-binding protein